MASKKADTPIVFVLLTLDAHLADAFAQVRATLSRDLPQLDLRVHIAADWTCKGACSAPGNALGVSCCDARARANADIAEANIIACTQLFSEEYVRAVLPAVQARRPEADAIYVGLCAPELVQCTKLGKFVMGSEEKRSAFSPIELLKKLRGSREDGKNSAERQLKMLKTLPKLLRFIPGTAQDLRIYLLGLQYWLAGTDDNIANMIKLLVERYASGPRAMPKGTLKIADPISYPETGVYHPTIKGRRISDDISQLPKKGATGTVGMLLGRSYLLAGNTAHYDAVIAALEGKGLRVIPAYASGLDGRPAIEAYFKDATGRTTIDAMISLTGFSLVGGPAYNDSAAAQAVLTALDVPYMALQTLEFQTIEEWQNDARGLNPLQATLQVAIPELDGATAPMVYGGKGRPKDGAPAASEPIAERVGVLANRVARLVTLKRTERAKRKVAIVLFNFPPNAGNTGSAAYLAVFPSLIHTLTAMKAQGYTVDVPSSPDEMRLMITEGNREQYGTPAAVHARVSTDDHVRREVHLKEIEATWGPAPGRALSDGRSLFIMGVQCGNVFIGVQPSFGWEGDPMRLLFEGNFAPTHAFSAFYRWISEDFGAHAVLHFGTHGALEFMPGKQAGLSDTCWPERLIGSLPNIYLYASNNSSEGTLAKRRGGATLVSYLTPPIATAGLYKQLAELKATLDRFRSAEGHERTSVAPLLQLQASGLELCAAEPAWTEATMAAVADVVREKLLELEYALIPVGLHAIGEAMGDDDRRNTLEALANAGRPELDLPALDQLCRDAGLSTDDAEALVKAACTTLVRERSVDRAVAQLAERGVSDAVVRTMLSSLAEFEKMLAVDSEVPGVLRALDARYVPPAPGGDLVRNPQILPTGRNLYGFDPYRVPSGVALVEGRVRAQQLLERYTGDHDGALPETIAMVLWGTDNMKSEGAPMATALALMGAVPRFDSVGRLAGARLISTAQLGRPRVDVVITLSGIFRDLLPLQVRLLAEAALLCAQAEEAPEENFIRKHALAYMAEHGTTLETAALRVFGNDDGAYGSNVNLLIDTGKWENEDELADQFVRRKGWAYGAGGRAQAQPALMKAVLGTATMAFQNLDSVELGATDIDQYVESLGGMTRVIAREARENGTEAPTVYLGDHTGAKGKIRTLDEQVALETRTRLLNPKWYEGQLKYGYEGVRNIAGHVSTTLGWSATVGNIPQWVYTDVTNTFILDAEMRERLAAGNPNAAAGMAQKLLEANERGYWTPDEATLAALREASAELEDRLEGVFA